MRLDGKRDRLKIVLDAKSRLSGNSKANDLVVELQPKPIVKK